MTTQHAPAHDAAHTSPTDAELDARFAPVFERIAAGSIEREQKRELAHEPVQWLKDAGFTALRVPRRYGGGGATLPQFFRQLTRLGEADSNLPQILRLNFGFIEGSLERDDEVLRERWLTKISWQANWLVRRFRSVPAQPTTPSPCNGRPKAGA
jgi:alkylation response protein AidB-like acyl-CoA dehydrogenase